jgi:hypothetical protein
MVLVHFRVCPDSGASPRRCGQRCRATPIALFPVHTQTVPVHSRQSLFAARAAAFVQDRQPAASGNHVHLSI